MAQVVSVSLSPRDRNEVRWPADRLAPCLPCRQQRPCRHDHAQEGPRLACSSGRNDGKQQERRGRLGLHLVSETSYRDAFACLDDLADDDDGARLASDHRYKIGGGHGKALWGVYWDQ